MNVIFVIVERFSPGRWDRSPPPICTPLHLTDLVRLLRMSCFHFHVALVRSISAFLVFRVDSREFTGPSSTCVLLRFLSSTSTHPRNSDPKIV